MIKPISILLLLTLTGCTAGEPRQNPISVEVDAIESLPEGFTLVEVQSEGLFLRIASSEHASDRMIRTIATRFAQQVDRIDFCLDSAHERGDEYASIIGDMFYDYENDKITTLK
ncbi:MAG: hypothetical protein UH625_04480 [Muribaculaceae bacterium]|nr:hypothetical protein [Muribaculaceae bacterium]